MRFAEDLARRSTCERSTAGVGAVITTADYRRVVGLGYNGGPAGGRNECKRIDGEIIPGQCGHLHAETNAIINCDHTGPKKVFVTMQPCEMCAIALVNLHASRGPIVEVYYHHPYRLTEGLDVLWSAGIPLFKAERRSFSVDDGFKFSKQFWIDEHRGWAVQ
jgi:dCMP deaminase